MFKIRGKLLLIFMLTIVLLFLFPAALLLVVFFFMLHKLIRHCRPASRPAFLPADLHNASFKSLHAHCRYLRLYMLRLAINPSLANHANVQSLHQACSSIDDALSAHPLRDDLIREIEHTEHDVLPPLIEHLTAQTDTLIEHTARELVQTISTGAFRSFEALIFLYRTSAMVLHISCIFSGKTNCAAKVQLFSDILRIIIRMNITEQTIQILRSHQALHPAPGQNRSDLHRALGAALLTNAIGRAAVHCSTSLRPNPVQSAAKAIQTESLQADTDALFTRPNP